MTCFRVDADIAFDPRALQAGNGAIGAWVRMVSYCHEYETDGVIPEKVALNIASEEEILALLEVKLLEEHGEDFAVVDYLKSNRTEPSNLQVAHAACNLKKGAS